MSEHKSNNLLYLNMLIRMVNFTLFYSDFRFEWCIKREKLSEIASVHQKLYRKTVEFDHNVMLRSVYMSSKTLSGRYNTD